MTKAQHTPGPWRFEKATGIGAPYGVFSKPTEACVAGIHRIHKEGVTEANARLIAATPEMLDALEMFVEEWPKRGSDNDVDVAFTMAIIALEKVRGK